MKRVVRKILIAEMMRSVTAVSLWVDVYIRNVRLIPVELVFARVVLAGKCLQDYIIAA